MKSDSNKFKQLIALCSVLAIIGLLLIFFSNSIGGFLADSSIEQNGYFNLSDYKFLEQVNTNKFLIIGGILFGVNLIGLLFAQLTELYTNK